MTNNVSNPEISIKESLIALAKREKMSLLWAVESGSRAWGFASPDSDYDVRGIYVFAPEQYLKIFPPRESIEFISDKWFDLGLWDMRKVARLLQRVNPVIYEWFNSKIIYYKNEFFAEHFGSLLDFYFEPNAFIYHYRGIAKGAMARMQIESLAAKELETQEYSLKKFFYLLRSLLAANFVLQEGKIPPIEIDKLLQNHSPELKEEIAQLITIKAEQNESYKHKISANLWEFMAEIWTEIKKTHYHPNKDLKSISPADDFFKKLLDCGDRK